MTEPRIYLSPPEVTERDREHLLRAIDSNWIAPVGPDLDRFEQAVAVRCGRRFAVGLTSGTAALHLALLELGIGPGHEVLVPTLTFAGTAFPVRYCGATPVFVDVDATSWQVSTPLMAEALAARRADGADVRAIIGVDLYGACADNQALVSLAESEGLAFVEDAAEALGGTHRGRPAGAYGVAGVVSFNGNKIVTTSGGGALVTDDERLAARVRHLATQAREPVLHYEHVEVGFNYRLSNLLAAFGLGQLEDLDQRVARRARVKERYRGSLGDRPGLRFMPEPVDGTSNHWLTCLLIDPDVAGTDRDAVIAGLAAGNIEARPTWKPLHLQPVFIADPRLVDGTAEAVFRQGLCLPSGSGLADRDQDRVIDLLLDLLPS